MATGTALDLITASLKRLGVISGIETPAADLAEDALARLNELIETWSTENLSLWTNQKVGIGSLPPLVIPPNSVVSYTIGPGGDIDVPVRPPWINGASWVQPGSPLMEYPLTPMSDEEWRIERVKNLTSIQPTHFHYYTDWPLGQLHFWPTPSVTIEVGVYLPQPITSKALLTTVFDLPPGYSRALRDCLALELAPELGVPVNPALAQSAIDAKSQLQRTNFRPRLLGLPPEIATGNYGGYDWRTD